LVIDPARVEAADLIEGAGRFVVGDARLETGGEILLQARFDALARLSSGAAAIGRLDLVAVVARRVVAGGDHDTGGRAFRHHVVADGWGRRVGAGEPDDDAVS